MIRRDLFAHRDLINLKGTILSVGGPDRPAAAPLLLGQPLNASTTKRLEVPDEHAGTLAGLDYTLVAEHAQRLPRSHAGHAVRGHQLVLSRKPITRTVLARLDRLAQGVRDPLVLGPTVIVGAGHSGASPP
ncbi:hypothetical protein HEK131_47360 [Streptomyces seoulensis]|nr:hypothetical protein HEK131_47360 [Streptomyces seoulensis]